MIGVEDVRTAKFDGLGRGVWIAPWTGPNGEIVLFKRDRWKRLVGEPRMIQAGENHVLIGEQMWEELDAADPVPELRII